MSAPQPYWLVGITSLLDRIRSNSFYLDLNLQELRAPGESPNPKKEDSYNLISYSLSLSLLNFKEEQGKKKSIPLAPKLFE